MPKNATDGGYSRMAPGRLVNPGAVRKMREHGPASSLQLYQAKKSRFRHVGCNLLPRCNLMSTLGVCAVQGGCVGAAALGGLLWPQNCNGTEALGSFSEQRITGDAILATVG